MVIPINSLAQGRTEYSWHADREFFASFDSEDIVDASLDVDASVEKSGRYIGIDCRICGHVTVQCDRCLGDLEIPVDTTVRFSVKFGQEPEMGTRGNDDEREIVFLPEDDTDLDMSQIVYDYTCLSLPMQRVHPDGECDPETVKYISSGEMEQTEETEAVESPFAALKTMIDNK